MADLSCLISTGTNSGGRELTLEEYCLRRLSLEFFILAEYQLINWSLFFNELSAFINITFSTSPRDDLAFYKNIKYIVFFFIKKASPNLMKSNDMIVQADSETLGFTEFFLQSRLCCTNIQSNDIFNYVFIFLALLIHNS